ncbi:MAG: protealysin inhibitor emfourin [Thermoanaerobaculaceae bacterium]
MRVKLERSGGLANVHRSVSVDAAALAPERAEELRRLVAAANLSKFPDNPTPIAGRPDRFIYKLTVEDESAAHTVTVSEDVATEDLQRLVDWLQHTAEG